MTDADPANAPKAKPKAAAIETPKFPTPSFDMPKFDVPSFEVPPAFREFAEKGIAQAKENYEKMQDGGRSRRPTSWRTPTPRLQGLCELWPEGDRDHAAPIATPPST